MPDKTVKVKQNQTKIPHLHFRIKTLLFISYLTITVSLKWRWSFLRRSKMRLEIYPFHLTALLHTGIIDFPAMFVKTRARSYCPRFLPSWGSNQIMTNLFLMVQWGNLWAADNEPLPALSARNWTNLSTGCEKGMIWEEILFFKTDTWW